MNRKIIFFDIDGTIYDYRNGVTKSTRQAIEKLHENGHLCFICTGRSKATVFDPEILSLPFDGMVSGCGTNVIINGVERLNYCLPEELLKDTLWILERFYMEPVLEGRDWLYYRKERRHDLFMDNLERKIPEILLPIPKEAAEIQANKMSVSMSNIRFSGYGLEWLKKYYTIIGFSDYFMELIPKGFSKATGIKFVCDALNIDITDTYAFGDSANDIEMLRFAGYSVAMGNASKEAKEAADYTTTAIDEDGIYNAVKKLKLID